MNGDRTSKPLIIQRYSKPYLYEQFNLSRIKIKKKKSFQEVYHSDDEYSSGNYMKRKLNQIDQLRNSKAGRHSRSVETNLIKNDYEVKSDKLIDQNGSNCLLKDEKRVRGDHSRNSRDDSSIQSERSIKRENLIVRDNCNSSIRNETNRDGHGHDSNVEISSIDGQMAGQFNDQCSDSLLTELNSSNNDLIKLSPTNLSPKNYTLPMRRFLFQKISKVSKPKRKSTNLFDEAIFTGKSVSTEQNIASNKLKSKTLREQQSLSSQDSNNRIDVNNEQINEQNNENEHLYDEQNENCKTNVNESDDQLNNSVECYNADEKLILNEFDEEECLMNSLMADGYEYQSEWIFEEELHRSKEEQSEGRNGVGRFSSEEHEKIVSDCEEEEVGQNKQPENRTTHEEEDYEIEEQLSEVENLDENDAEYLQNSNVIDTLNDQHILYQNIRTNPHRIFCPSNHVQTICHHQAQKNFSHICPSNNSNIHAINRNSEDHSTGHSISHSMKNSTHVHPTHHHHCSTTENRTRQINRQSQCNQIKQDIDTEIEFLTTSSQAQHDAVYANARKHHHRKQDKQRTGHRMKIAMNQLCSHETRSNSKNLYLTNNEQPNKLIYRNSNNGLMTNNNNNNVGDCLVECVDRCLSKYRTKYDKLIVLDTEPTVQSPDCSTHSTEPAHFSDDRTNNETCYHGDYIRSYPSQNSDYNDQFIHQTNHLTQRNYSMNHSMNHSINKKTNHQRNHSINHHLNQNFVNNFCNQHCCSRSNPTYFDTYLFESNEYSGNISTQLLESELSVLKDQIEAQQDKIKEYEVKISELQAQLLITENSYQEMLKQKFRIEDEKNSLINELSRIKTINDDKIRLLESEISFFKKTLLERETEIASLRLYLAKMVRASNHLITENDSALSLSRSSDSLSKKNIEKVKRVSDKPPIAPRNYFNSQSQFKDSSLTGSFTMPSATNSSSKLANNHSIANHSNSSLQNQFMIKSSTPVLNDRSLSPINRLDLATSREQLEEFCKRDNMYDEKTQFNQFNYGQFVNQSPNSTCSTPNRSAKSSSSTSANNSLLKSADDSKLAYLATNKNSNPDLAKHAIRRGFDMIAGKDKSKGGFKWFFEKMKNNKTQLSQSGLSFSRSSLRATIGPLSTTRVDVNQKFNQWDSIILADWFGSIGLGNYSESVLRSMINGEQLANANDIQLEKFIQLKNHFHRKKLRLAIQTVNRTADEQTMKASKLDYVCVAKWLDDIGLPQYKELFLENRIDGAVLHHLTVDDLLRLKINTQLHHSSIRTGIYVLRANSFNQNCLKRRASPTSTNEPSNGELNSFNMSSLESSIHTYDPTDVCLWTCHRVYEWLKSIDLAEYVANLRGSGVHGALIILDDTFNANVLATLLSIPLNKTLLRRHISTYFIQLVGFEIGQRKHLHQDKTGSSLISAKVKLSKKSNFRNSFRKKKHEEYVEEYVCPMASHYSPQDTFNHTNGTSPYHSNSNGLASSMRARFENKQKIWPENVDHLSNNETNNFENTNKDHQTVNSSDGQKNGGTGSHT